jgi:acid stress chaperone HdeA
MYRTAAVLAAIGVALAGCAGIGDESTTCKDFNGMSQDTRSATVANVLKARNGRNASTSDVLARVETTLEFCSAGANQDRTVGDVK